MIIVAIRCFFIDVVCVLKFSVGPEVWFKVSMVQCFGLKLKVES
jgi:hypothetical protein